MTTNDTGSTFTAILAVFLLYQGIFQSTIFFFLTGQAKSRRAFLTRRLSTIPNDQSFFTIILLAL